jgi:type I restriction enzyme S subunit
LENIFTVSDDDGTVFGSINKDDLYNIEVVIPSVHEMTLFEKEASVIDKGIKLQNKENNVLTELQSLLLAKMGQ